MMMKQEILLLIDAHNYPINEIDTQLHINQANYALHPY